MKKLLSTVLLIALTAIFALSLCGCSKYNSSYSATTVISTNTSKKGAMKFGSFSGTMVFKLKTGEGHTSIDYAATLESGSATVYYDADGTKEKLFTIEAGGSFESSIENLGEGTVYIIVEANEKCGNGDFSFTVK